MKEKFLNGLKWFFRSFIWLGIILLGVDILTKQIVRNAGVPDGGLVADWGIVRIRYVLNYNAAFGLGASDHTVSRVLYLVFASLISAGIVTYLIIKRKTTKLFIRAALVMVVTGAIGNMIDRIFYGPEFAVVDWIDFYWFWKFNFNIADCCVVIAAFMLIIYVIVMEVKDYLERRKKEGVQVKQLSKTEQERLQQQKKDQEQNEK